MRTKWMLLGVLVLIFTPLLSTICYCIDYVCIDPGHGGSDSGTVGRVYHYPEKNANLKVALALRDTLNHLGYPDSTIVVMMTRENDVFRTPQWRAAFAMGNNPDSAKVNQFLIIHHNATGSTTDTTTNGTETWWSTSYWTPEGEVRDNRSYLTMSVQGKMVETLNWRNRGIKDGLDTLAYVLHHTTMISALPEISFITCKTIDSLFYYDTTYARKEAGSVYRGWRHYIENDPIITVQNHFGGYVSIDGVDRVSPYYGAYCPGEYHTIRSFNQWWDGDNYYYCKWWDGNPQEHGISVGYMDQTHTAYHSYDYYYVHVDHPNDYGLWWLNYEIGKNLRIYWSADPGVHDPPWCWWTSADIYLSRDGGNNYETIVTNYDMTGLSEGRYDWTITGLASNQCRIKIVAHDDACNLKEDISDHNFFIKYNATVQAPLAGYEWQIGGYVSQYEYNILWEASAGSDSSTLIDIFLSRNGGNNWATIATNQPNTGSYRWEVRGDVSNDCKIKIKAHDSAGNVAEAVSDTFAITYKMTLTSPNHFMCTGWGWPFTWNVSRGENGTTVVDIYLSRNGGASYDEHLGSISWPNRKFSWLVTAPHTELARVKLWAHDSFGHNTEYITPYTFTICGGCIRGDINHNSVYYEVADAVMFAHWFADSTNACDPDPVYGISPCDVKCDGYVHLSDLVFLVRVLLGDFIPCDEGPPYQPGPPPYAGEIEVKAKRNNLGSTISISSEYPLGALAFDFNTNGTIGNPVLITPNMQLKTSVQNGELRVLVWSENGESIPPEANDILVIPGNTELISVRAASYDYKNLKANVTNEITPSSYALFQNHPNPSNPSTQIGFILPNAIAYTLKIYDVLGQLVRIFGGMGSYGPNIIVWDGKDKAGKEVSSGIYFYHLQAGEYNEVRKMILMK